MDILKIKDTGVEVKKLQNQLIALGFLCHEPTGYFGTLTNTAVKKAQKKFGAIENGEVSETFFHFLEDKVKELTLWNMNELQEILQGEWLVRADEPNVIVNICNDNIKKVKGGSLFYSFDATFYSDIIGNLGLVFKNGASVVLVTKVIKEKLNDSWSVLLVDEPSIGLEPRYIDMVFEILRDLQQNEKKTIILVEQNAKKGLEFADIGYVLVSGQTAIAGKGDDLLNNTEVGRLFLGG